MENVGGPCLNCIVFVMCNGRVQEEGVTKMVIFGLATFCPILMNYLTYDSTKTVHLDNERIDNVRRVYGWKG